VEIDLVADNSLVVVLVVVDMNRVEHLELLVHPPAVPRLELVFVFVHQVVVVVNMVVVVVDMD
jgi:hypothetical protein